MSKKLLITEKPSVATEFRELIQSIKSNNYPQDIDESPLFKALYKLGGIIEVDNSKKPIIDFEVVLKNDFSSSINETLSKKAKSTKKQSICIEYFPNTGRLFVSKLFDTDSDIDINYSHKKIISLLLSGAITLGVSAPTVSAVENSRRRYNPSYLSDVAYD